MDDNIIIKCDRLRIVEERDYLINYRGRVVRYVPVQYRLALFYADLEIDYLYCKRIDFVGKCVFAEDFTGKTRCFQPTVLEEKVEIY